MPPPPFFWQQFMTAVPITFICAMQLQLFLFLFPINRICLQPFLTTSLTLCFFFLRFRIVYSCHPYAQTLTHTHTRTHTCSFAYGASLEFFRFKLYKRHTLFDKLVSSFLFFLYLLYKTQIVSPHLFFCLLVFQSLFFCFSIKRPFSQSLFFFFVSLLLTSTSFLSCSDIYIYIPLPFSLVLLSVTGASRDYTLSIFPRVSFFL